MSKENEKCNCDSPYRNYGEEKCLNCGGILDFERDKIFKINEDGSATEI